MVKVCSKQKSDVTNDVTPDLASMRHMSDIVCAAESNQVCRKEGEEKAGSKVMLFTSLPPLSFMRRPAALKAHGHCYNEKYGVLLFFQARRDPIHMPLPDHNRGGT